MDSVNPLFYFAVIPIFGVLVIAHEFGHFIVAKWAGIRVDEFAVGFPPRLASIQRGETAYSLNLIPLGGYVRMPGENGETTNAQGAYDPRAFGSKSASWRAAVLLAGVTMNLLLSVVLFTGAEAFGTVEFRPVIDVVVKDSPAQQAGLRSGDTILSVNGQAVKYFSDMRKIVANEVSAAGAQAKTVPVTLVVRHKDASQATLVAQALTHPGPGQGALGVTASTADPYHIRPPLWQAPIKGVQDIGLVISATYEGIRQVIRGFIPVNQAFQGPVGIAKTTGQAAQLTTQIGPYPLFFLAAYLSLNLAVFNLFPVPGLDGGRLLFVIIEALRRGKRISPEREGLVHLIGFVALLFLVVLVTVNDVANFGH